jgi:hypothetical protein
VSSRAVTPAAEQSPSNAAIPANPVGTVTTTTSRPNYSWAILMMRVGPHPISVCPPG